MSLVESQTRRVFLGTLAAGAAVAAVEITQDPNALSAFLERRFSRPDQLLFTSTIACVTGCLLSVESHNGFTGVYVVERVSQIRSAGKTGLYMHRCGYLAPRVATHCPVWQFIADLQPQHWMPIYKL